MLFILYYLTISVYLSLGREIEAAVMDRRNRVIYYLDTDKSAIRAYNIPEKKDRVVLSNLKYPTTIRYIGREKLVLLN